MLRNIQNLLKEHRDAVLYLLFGVMTTVVNYIFYLPCYNFLGFSAAFSNIIAWVAAVAFAFLTNKPFVFQSMEWSVETVLPELLKFLGCRTSSGMMETLVLLLTVDTFGWNGNIWKILTSVMVVVLNFFGSKFLVFRK